jgi:hypothetical protein
MTDTTTQHPEARRPYPMPPKRVRYPRYVAVHEAGHVVDKYGDVHEGLAGVAWPGANFTHHHTVASRRPRSLAIGRLQDRAACAMKAKR